MAPTLNLNSRFRHTVEGIRMAEQIRKPGVYVAGTVLEAGRVFSKNHVAIAIHLGGKNVAEVVAWADKKSGAVSETGELLTALPVGQAVMILCRTMPGKDGEAPTYVASEIVAG